jgi:hypothetical protein
MPAEPLGPLAPVEPVAPDDPLAAYEPSTLGACDAFGISLSVSGWVVVPVAVVIWKDSGTDWLRDSVSA